MLTIIPRKHKVFFIPYDPVYCIDPFTLPTSMDQGLCEIPVESSIVFQNRNSVDNSNCNQPTQPKLPSNPKTTFKKNFLQSRKRFCNTYQSNHSERQMSYIDPSEVPSTLPTTINQSQVPFHSFISPSPSPSSLSTTQQSSFYQSFVKNHQQQTISIARDPSAFLHSSLVLLLLIIIISRFISPF